MLRIVPSAVENFTCLEYFCTSTVTLLIIRIRVPVGSSKTANFRVEAIQAAAALTTHLNPPWKQLYVHATSYF